MAKKIKRENVMRESEFGSLELRLYSLERQIHSLKQQIKNDLKKWLS